jgi:hypothetical protein
MTAVPQPATTTEPGTIQPPTALTALDQWVLWAWEHGTKVPKQANGQNASSTNPATWTTFQLALAGWQNHPTYFAGVGFVFAEQDPFVGIDLDDVVAADGLARWADVIVRRINSYWEVSPSGKGLKGWVRGSLPENIGHTTIYLNGQTVGAIEMYASRRFFTVTGNRWNSSPTDITDHAADLLELHAWARRFRPRAVSCVSDAGKILHGSQHLSLLSMAGAMRRKGMCGAAIEAALQIVNEKQCELHTNALLLGCARDESVFPVGAEDAGPRNRPLVRNTAILSGYTRHARADGGTDYPGPLRDADALKLSDQPVFHRRARLAPVLRVDSENAGAGNNQRLLDDDILP